jgi:3-hydroxyisobutyrate dehydrogenase
MNSIALIGFGEVGRIFAREMKAKGIEQIAVYDIAFADPKSGPSRAVIDAGVMRCASAAEALRGANIAVSAVTAEQALEAARTAARGIERGTFFFDLNSASPGVKRQAAEAIDLAGGRYVEAAVMTAVPPHGLRAPMLLGGTHAAAFLEAAKALDLAARVYAPEVGLASAVKMARSVMIKGMEALVTESMMTARHYGVEKDVLASLAETLPVPDWNAFARYMISRSLLHGRRRAEEMREVAKTVAEAGIEPLMSGSIAERQDATAALAREHGVDAKSLLPELLDAMLAAERDPGEGDSLDETVSGSAA